MEVNFESLIPFIKHKAKNKYIKSKRGKTISFFYFLQFSKNIKDNLYLLVSQDAHALAKILSILISLGLN